MRRIGLFTNSWTSTARVEQSSGIRFVLVSFWCRSKPHTMRTEQEMKNSIANESSMHQTFSVPVSFTLTSFLGANGERTTNWFATSQQITIQFVYVRNTTPAQKGNNFINLLIKFVWIKPLSFGGQCERWYFRPFVVDKNIPISDSEWKYHSNSLCAGRLRMNDEHDWTAVNVKWKPVSRCDQSIPTCATVASLTKPKKKAIQNDSRTTTMMI